MLAGLNRYRPLDEAYRGFVELVVGHVAAGIASARSYEAQQRRAEELADLDRAKTAFSSNISHEFRTPLTLIMGPVEELRDRLAESDPHAREELDVVHRNGLRLGKLVNTLLDFLRIEAGRMQAGYEPVDLVAVTPLLAPVLTTSGLVDMTTVRGLEDPPTTTDSLESAAAEGCDPVRRRALNRAVRSWRAVRSGGGDVQLADPVAGQETEPDGAGLVDVDVTGVGSRRGRAPSREGNDRTCCSTSTPDLSVQVRGLPFKRPRQDSNLRPRD